jgi:hypothetical protein
MKLMTAMAGAAAVTAGFVSGKATRDALFLTSLDFTALPTMLIATSAVSILLVALYARASRGIAPARLIPGLFAASGVLFVGEWLWRSHAPSVAAIVVYLHVSGVGPLLASGFWLIASERFDPRSAKRRFGQIAGAGTLGGFLSALLAERVAASLGAPAMLLVLAAIQFLCALLVLRLARGSVDGATARTFGEAAAGVHADAPASRTTPRSALIAVVETPYLRHLAALVLFGTTSAALVDYLFKAQAVETFGRGDNLLRFLALYYAATSFITFILQTSSSRLILEKFGIGLTTSTPSWALLIGSLGSLLAPGFGSLTLARGGESVFRSSWFRAGYELFYTPIPAAKKRVAKSLIDVGFDRMGDAVGGGLVRVASWLIPVAQSPVILTLAMASSALAVLAARRLNRGYLGTLASTLIDRGSPIPAPAAVGVTRTTRMLRRVIRGIHEHAAIERPDRQAPPTPVDPELRDILVLRSRNRAAVIEVLSRSEGLPAALVPHAIPLLAWDAVANHAMFALRKVAEERIGQLVDALIDPNQDFAVRRRLARVLSICVSARAADGALLGLDDVRFDVRFQSARSLASIVEKNPRISIDPERIFEVVLREVAVSRPVWESRRLLDGFRSESALDEFVRDRAGESLGHVFTLLALALPREPLQIAFRSLQTDDEQLRGTALEYLEGVLPASIRRRIWPFLEIAPAGGSSRPRHEVIAELLQSHHSVVLNLESLRQRGVRSVDSVHVRL